jgi:hypothetical protein
MPGLRNAGDRTRAIVHACRRSERPAVSARRVPERPAR